jgi:hypothetical protein
VQLFETIARGGKDVHIVEVSLIESDSGKRSDQLSTTLTIQFQRFFVISKDILKDMFDRIAIKKMTKHKHSKDSSISAVLELIEESNGKICMISRVIVAESKSNMFSISHLKDTEFPPGGVQLPFEVFIEFLPITNNNGEANFRQIFIVAKKQIEQFKVFFGRIID